MVSGPGLAVEWQGWRCDDTNAGSCPAMSRVIPVAFDLTWFRQRKTPRAEAARWMAYRTIKSITRKDFEKKLDRGQVDGFPVAQLNSQVWDGAAEIVGMENA